MILGCTKPHFKAVVIAAIVCAQSMTVIQIELQPLGCTQAVMGLYIIAVLMKLQIEPLGLFIKNIWFFICMEMIFLSEKTKVEKFAVSAEDRLCGRLH